MLFHISGEAAKARQQRRNAISALGTFQKASMITGAPGMRACNWPGIDCWEMASISKPAGLCLSASDQGHFHTSVLNVLEGDRRLIKATEQTAVFIFTQARRS